MLFGPKRQQQQQDEKMRKEESTDTAPKAPNFYHNQNHDTNNNDIYDYYLHNLIPALTSSLPILCYKLVSDGVRSVLQLLHEVWNFLLPSWYQNNDNGISVPPWLLLPWNITCATEKSGEHGSNNAIAEFVLRHFDNNNDGHISASELLHPKVDIDVEWPQLNPEALHQYLQSHNINLPSTASVHPKSVLEWISSAWPLTDWKIGIFLWRTCGGLLCVIVVLTIIPGKLHNWSGKILRWPILALTYFMIAVELVIYVLIRLFIRAVEHIFANSHHRQLRSALSKSKSYNEWYGLANMLDISQNRTEWKCTTTDDTRCQYNWSFIHELIVDLKKARQEQDSLMALAVLQQCTRKNVGGVMSEDLFTYMNTGETKIIVREFVREVVKTLRWVTEQAKMIPVQQKPLPLQELEGTLMTTTSTEREETIQVIKGPEVEQTIITRTLSEEEKNLYQEKLNNKVKEERNKVRYIQGLPKHYSSSKLEKKRKHVSFQSQQKQEQQQQQQQRMMISRDLILTHSKDNERNHEKKEDPNGLHDLIKVAKTLVPPIVWDGIVSPVVSNFVGDDHDHNHHHHDREKEGNSGQKKKRGEKNNDDDIPVVNDATPTTSSFVETRELKKDVPIHEHLLSWATLSFFGNEHEKKNKKSDKKDDDDGKKTKREGAKTEEEEEEEEEGTQGKNRNDSKNQALSLPGISTPEEEEEESGDDNHEERALPRDDDVDNIPHSPPEPMRQRTTSTGSSASSTTSVLPPMHRETVKTFLKRARAAYGRTALCLSGGAMMGNYHFGSVKALLENDALPHIISGTSAGSAIGALICTRTDEELKEVLKPEILADKLLCFSRPWRERIKSFWECGCMFDNEEWLRMIKWFTCGELTFQEAYRKTGRVLCITLSATTKKAPPVLLNYVTAPDVVIASAIIASAAVPGFLKPVLLQVKDADGVVRRQEENKDQTYWDGSIEQDIPTAGLAEMLNCQFFLAAQANPHIVPFFYNSKGDVGRPSRWSRGMKDDSWRGGFLLSALELYLKSDMRAKFHFLNDLEAAVGFTSTLMTQQYGGTTTIVPQVCLKDYFKLFSNPTLDDLYRYFQVGSVAAYQHIAMVKLHYEIANALDECLDALESDEVVAQKPPRRLSQLNLQSLQKKGKISGAVAQRGKEKEFSLTSSTLRTVNNATTTSTEPAADADSGNDGNAESCSTSISGDVDEVEIGGFEGVDCAFTPRRVSVKPATKD